MKTQEDSDIEKRLLLAILLSMAILFVTPYVYRTISPPTEVPAEETIESIELEPSTPAGQEEAAVPEQVPERIEEAATRAEPETEAIAEEV